MLAEPLWRIRLQLAWRRLKESWALFKENPIDLVGLAIIAVFGVMALAHPILMKYVWEPRVYDPVTGYDIAMMIGCLGMEKPQSLTGDLVVEFVNRFKDSGLIAEKSWSYLFDFVLALRFAWLSDWLKRSDPEMIDLEAVYIQLLLDNREIFIRSWGI